MYTIRKWMFKPKKTDQSLLAQFFYADEELNMVATELDSFDGRKDPERCSTLVNQLRLCQDKVLTIIDRIMEEHNALRRSNRDFRVKFPDDVLQDGFAGQLWFGAECLAAGSSIMNREVESASMRPLARVLTRHLDFLRSLLRDQCLKNGPTVTPRIKEALELYDRLLAEFELSYVSAMVPVKTMREYDMLQEVIVLFCETTQRALKLKLLAQDMVDDYDPALMFTIPRLAIVSGLLIYPEGPINPDMDPMRMSEMFRPFQTLLYKIRELLWTLSRDELWMLEKSLCSTEDPGLYQNTVDPLSSLDDLENPPYSPTFHPALAGHPGEFPAAAGEAADLLYDTNGNCANAAVAELGHDYFMSHSPSVQTVVAMEDCRQAAEGNRDSDDSGTLSENGSVLGGPRPNMLGVDHRTLRHSVSWPEPRQRQVPVRSPYCDDAVMAGSRPTCVFPGCSREFNFHLPVNTAQITTQDNDLAEGDSDSKGWDTQQIYITSNSTGHPSSCGRSQISFVTDSLNQVFVTDQSSLTDQEVNLMNTSKCCCGAKHDVVQKNRFVIEDHDDSLTSPSDLMETSLEEKSATEPLEKDMLVANVQDCEFPNSGAQMGARDDTFTQKSQTHRCEGLTEGERAHLRPCEQMSSCDSRSHVTCDTGCARMPGGARRMAGTIKSCLEVPQPHRPKCCNCRNHSSHVATVECDWDRESYASSETSSYNSECNDDEEIALAIQAAELAARKEARSRFKNSTDLIHRLFVCISGVADQLQTNYASDLRHILKSVFNCNASEPFVAMETPADAALEDGMVGDEDSASEESPSDEGHIVQGEEATENLHQSRSHEEPPAWVPDEESPHCTSCKVFFNFVRRRHHCRNCGKVFCGRCSSNAVTLPHYGHTKPVRVCNHCFMFQVTPFTVD